ncbi:oxidoreductase [Advenella sp. S44]|uniref:SDR family NAD(P)-dependent oxidoreductase n=1 Tax=Advenella sp. S44 TaxID=1982755 RepID=UPI000C2A794B|nr:3-oxoacyl-ACP reductase FabG [Advenella sp. S44]PJX23842.1 oxidoreductase [Advenella sp. S44]
MSEGSANKARVAVITGGGNGIGRAIVEAFAYAGYLTIIADINQADALALEAALNARSLQARYLGLDVADADSIAQFFATVERDYGRCDVLVNNAGIAKSVAYLDYPKDQWEKVMQINITGPFLMSQCAGRLMQRRQSGRIVNIASVSGERASWGRAAYGTSKAAIFGLTRQMALELAEFGITANGVAPGPVDTPLTQQLHTQVTRDKFLDAIPMRRYGTPQEIAQVCLFLASEAASYVNGHVIPVDGGFLAAGITDH